MTTSQLPAATRLRRELTDPDGDWQCRLIHSDHAQAGIRIDPTRRTELLDLADKHGVTLISIDRWTARTPGFVLDITSTHLPKRDIAVAIATVLLDWDASLKNGHTPPGAHHTKAADLPRLSDLAQMDQLRGYTARKIATPIAIDAEALLMGHGPHQGPPNTYGTSVEATSTTIDTLAGLLADHLNDIDLTGPTRNPYQQRLLDGHVTTALSSIELLEAAIALSVTPPERKVALPHSPATPGRSIT